MDDNLRITVMSKEASKEMHKAIFQSLKAINDYFEQPHAAKKNLSQDMKVANSVINTFAKIRQHESGRDMVLLQAGKMLTESRGEFREFVEDNLPHLDLGTKALSGKLP